MAHEKVYGFCENKCKVEVAPKTETDAVEERVTKLEAGDFNGTVSAENFTGKINVDSVAPESGGIAVYKLTYENVSIAKHTMVNTAKTVVCPKGVTTWLNSSILNYTNTSTLCETCTVTVSVISGVPSQSNNPATTLTVINDSTNAVVISETIGSSKFEATATKNYTFDFLRNVNDTYTIKLLSSTTHGNWSVAVSTSNPNYTYCVV